MSFLLAYENKSPRTGGQVYKWTTKEVRQGVVPKLFHLLPWHHRGLQS